MVSGAGHFGKKTVETLCCAFGNWMEQFEPKKTLCGENNVYV